MGDQFDYYSELCQHDTEEDCSSRSAAGAGARIAISDSGTTAGSPVAQDEWIEEELIYGFRVWHVMCLSILGILTLIILLCCCLKFRIPRTKQEIEGDYIRRKILRKFRRRLKTIQNQEMDDMDLKKALDKIRSEFKSDTESIAQSEAISVGTVSSNGAAGGAGHRHTTSTYRRASQIAMNISLEDLRAHSLGVGARVALAISRFFGRSRVADGAQTQRIINKEAEPKPTSALNPDEVHVEIPSGHKSHAHASAEPQVSSTKKSGTSGSKGSTAGKSDKPKGAGGSEKSSDKKKDKVVASSSGENKGSGKSKVENNEKSKKQTSVKEDVKKKNMNKTKSKDTIKIENEATAVPKAKDEKKKSTAAVVDNVDSKKKEGKSGSTNSKKSTSKDEKNSKDTKINLERKKSKKDVK